MDWKARNEDMDWSGGRARNEDKDGMEKRDGKR